MAKPVFLKTDGSQVGIEKDALDSSNLVLKNAIHIIP